MGSDLRVDVVVFGGGAAGLWTLDVLRRQGVSALLLEAGELGRGQTIAAQGILHGGLKYTLQGLLTPAATSIAGMPDLWRECLAGRREPRLTATRVRSESCHLWRTDSIASRVGMIGARFGLRVAPRSVPADDRPAVLRHCPGDVARLNEQVISPASLLADLAARNDGRLLRIDAEHGLDFSVDPKGNVTVVTLHRTERLAGGASGSATETIRLRPRHVVFAAGAGNAELRRCVGLSPHAMQRRPLHMVLARGDLPALNGHCVDGAKTRVTITTDADAAGCTVWQVGGQIAEDGVSLSPRALALRAADELRTSIPGLDLSRVEIGTLRVDRAEGVVPGGKRPDSFLILSEGNVLTAWPTKLVLAPLLAEELARRLADAAGAPAMPLVPDDWPRPVVAAPPWETCANWAAFEQPARRAA